MSPTDAGKEEVSSGGGNKNGAEGIGGGTRSFPQSTEAPSAAAVSSDEGFFTTHTRDATWKDSWTAQLSPASIIDNRRLLFHIPKMDGDLFPYLNEAKLKLAVRLLDKDGQKPRDDCTIAPVCNVGNAMINALTITLNGTTVMSCASGLYPYWAYTSSLLNNSSDRKKSMLQLAGFFEDNAECWDQITKNGPWDKRRLMFGSYDVNSALDPNAEVFVFKTNLVRTLYIPLCTEFTQPAPLLNYVGGSLEITLNDPGFYLQCNLNEIEYCRERQFALKIDAAELLLPVREMNPQLSLNLERELKDTPLEYRNTRMDLKKFLIPKGSQTFTTDQLKQNAVCPDRLLFFLIPDWLLDQSYGLSPFRCTGRVMEQYDTLADKAEKEKTAAYLTNVRMTVNNQSLESTASYVNHEDLLTAKFMELLICLGLDRSEYGIPLEISEYAHGKCMMAYDLTRPKRAALSGGTRLDVKTGTLKLDLNFSAILPCNSYLLVLSEFHSKVSITKNRTVYYTFID